MPTYAPIHATQGACSHIANDAIILYREIACGVPFRVVKGIASRSCHGALLITTYG